MNGVVEPILHRNTPSYDRQCTFHRKKNCKEHWSWKKKKIKTKNYWNQNTGITGLNTHIQYLLWFTCRNVILKNVCFDMYFFVDIVNHLMLNEESN